MIFRDLFIVICIYLLWRFYRVWRSHYVPRDVKEILRLIQPFSRFNREAFRDLVNECILFYRNINEMTPHAKYYFENQVDEIIYNIDKIDLETPDEPYTDMVFEQCRIRLRNILNSQIVNATKRYQ